MNKSKTTRNRLVAMQAMQDAREVRSLEWKEAAAPRFAPRGLGMASGDPRRPAAIAHAAVAPTSVTWAARKHGDLGR